MPVLSGSAQNTLYNTRRPYGTEGNGEGMRAAGKTEMTVIYYSSTTLVVISH